MNNINKTDNNVTEGEEECAEEGVQFWVEYGSE
jgi:hypothetical protein